MLNEIASFTRMENFRRGPYANMKTKWTGNPYLDVNRIFRRDNVGNAQGHEEQKSNPNPEPSNCKIRRFEMMKYSFDDDEDYITIKESEYLNHSKDSLDAYRELLRLIDEGWVEPYGHNPSVWIRRIDPLTLLKLWYASNWLERLPVRSISTWEDLTTRFLAQFFPSGRTTKLRNDILMFQQHQGEYIFEAWAHFKNLLQKVPHHGIDLWLQVQIFYDHVNPATRRTIDQSADGKLHDNNTEESWALLEDLTLYDNESWNDPRDSAKPVKAIYFPQEVLSTFDRRLIELEN
ncbi:zinc finger, CCHC-type containing protein [Tanacetum coccineum]